MAPRKSTTTNRGSAKTSTRGAKTTASKGTAPKVARAKRGGVPDVDPKRSKAGRKAAKARWAKTKRADTTGTE